MPRITGTLADSSAICALRIGGSVTDRACLGCFPSTWSCSDRLRAYASRSAVVPGGAFGVRCPFSLPDLDAEGHKGAEVHNRLH